MSVRSHALRSVPEGGHMRMPSWSAMSAALVHVVLWPLRIVVRFQVHAIERETIARMDDRMLRDVGLTRADAWVEATKLFWR